MGKWAEKLSIQDRVDDMILERKIARLNEFNPICPGCNRRDDIHMICYDVKGQKMCAQCADDYTYLTTGCRFGNSPCTHEDCAI